MTTIVGFFATSDSPAGVAGLFYGGGFDQLWRQAVGAAAVMAYSGIVTAVIAFALKFTIGLRISDEDEVTGIDETEHAETGYDFSSLRGGGGLGTARPPKAPSEPVAATAGSES